MQYKIKDFKSMTWGLLASGSPILWSGRLLCEIGRAAFTIVTHAESLIALWECIADILACFVDAFVSCLFVE